MNSPDLSISYKTESNQTFLNITRRLNRNDNSANDSEKIEFYTLFIDIKKCFQSNDEENILDALMKLSSYLFHENHLPSNITNFFIDDEILPIFSTLLVNPLKEDILIYVLKILYQLVHLSITDDLDFHIFLFKNNILKILFDIREFIPFTNISTYIHLVANFSFCSLEARNQILNQFPESLLESLMIEQGTTSIDIRQETSFLIWRMTIYDILNDKSISDFIGWFVNFFSKYYRILDLTSLRYWLFALDNMMFSHNEIQPIMLISYGYSEIINFFIKTRSNSFTEYQKEEDDDQDAKRLEIYFQDKNEIDELLEIILKVVEKFIEKSLENISEDIVLDLFAIANENWKICSEYSARIIKHLIKKSRNIYLFEDIDNIQILLEIYDSAKYSFKYEIIFLLYEVISISDTNYAFNAAKFVIPKLIQNLNDTNDFRLIKYIIDLLSLMLWLGVRKNGEQINEFYKIFAENQGFDFLYNYREKLEGLDIDEEGLANLESLIQEIKDYFPSEEEDFPMDEERDPYQ